MKADEFRRQASLIIARKMGLGDVSIRIADSRDIPSLVDINSRSLEYLGRAGLLMEMKEEFFRDMIDGGIVILLERDKIPVGYSSAIPADSDRPDFLDSNNPDGVGLLFGSAIEMGLHGKGWHRWLINLRLEIFHQSGFGEIQCTVSPFNTPSLINLLRCGFCVVALKTILDDHQRFIVCSRPGSARPEVRNLLSPILIDVSSNLNEHKKLLDSGYEGVALKYSKNGRKKAVSMMYQKRTDWENFGKVSNKRREG